MKVVRNLKDIRTLSGSVGFVPTMGALHEGHLSLIRASKSLCDSTVVSIFVNPLQFGPNEDLSKYPRTEARDLELIERVGADVTFVPLADELLTSNLTTVRVTGVTEFFEGERRPGHFDGVATIVCKLFNLMRPSHAFFGLKDRQQCAVIKQMVSDLNLPIELVFEPTIREPDGLAMSSRNVYLSPLERAIAPRLYQCLQSTRTALSTPRDIEEDGISNLLEVGATTLTTAGFVVDYYDLVNENSFAPTRNLGANTVLVAAAKLGVTRIIDNIEVMANTSTE